MPLSQTDAVARKRELRKHYKAIRHALSAEERSAAEAVICKQLCALPCFTEAETLLAYYPIGDEPNLCPVIEEAFRRHKQVAFPVCDPETSTMVFRTVPSLSALRVGAHGIPEPSDDCPVLNNFSGALCIVPALAFDLCGYRIGYGKGYYDRFLEKVAIQTVGATYHALVTESLPHEPTDRAVSILMTERGILLPNEEYAASSPIV